MMKRIFNTSLLLGLALALAVASLQISQVFAAGSNEPTPPPRGELTTERLEKIWAKQLRVYEKMGKAEDIIAKSSELVDRASQNGKDVSAVQSALDAFAEAVKDAKPIYASAKGIVNSHQGFDSNGKVTDFEKAKDTVRQMGEKLKEIREAMYGTGQALHEAILAFREANPRPERPSTP